jgi:small-conductance mechanosensitive channel
VIPNALLGSGKVVNYMPPDPSYRVQTELHVVYGSDHWTI